MKQGFLARSTERRLTERRRGASKHRVLIADEDTHFARRLANYLYDLGFETRIARSVTDAKEAVEFWHPQSVFVNAVLGGVSAATLLHFVQGKDLKPRIAVMATHSNSDRWQPYKNTTIRTLLKPFPVEEALKVIEEADPNEAAEKSSPRELYLMGLLLKQANWLGPKETRLFNLLRMIGMKVRAARCSLIALTDRNGAVVIASNDDENVAGLRLNMANYPEIQHVKLSGRRLIIPNIRTSDMMAPVRQKLEAVPYESLALFPVFWRGKLFAVLSLRVEQKTPDDMYYLECFGEVCSQILTLALK